MRTRPPYLPEVLLGAALAVSLGSCAARRERSVSDLVMWGEYQEAVELSARQLKRSPDDEELQEQHRQARVAYLLGLARRYTFEDRDEDALEVLEQALALDGDSPQVLDWIDKTRRKVAEEQYLRAREHHAEEELPEALELYQIALAYDPDLQLAREGLARVFLQLNYRDGLAQEYYNDGVRNLRRDELEISRSRFDYSTKYRPGDERASRRQSQVEEMLGRQRVSSAAALEEDGLFAAAEREYAMALAYFPESPEALEGLRRTAIEAEADRKAVRATQMILREEWESARDVLGEALELSQLRKDEFEGRIATIEEARLEAQYESALDLETDFRYPAAIEAYEQILTERDFFLDVRSRIDTLREYIERAEQLYAAAEEAEEPGVQLFHLLQIDLFWPEYRDLPERIRALEGVEPVVPPEPEAPEEPGPAEEPAEETDVPAPTDGDDGR